MRRLIFSERAKRDLEGVRAYIALDKPTAAKAFAQRLIDTCHAPLDFPEMGRVGRRSGTRELTLWPYVIVYRTTRDAITIERIQHGAQRH